MKGETKTAEEFIREKVRLKYNAINKLTKALWTYDVNGEECLRWAKEFSGLQLTQQQSANAELKQKLQQANFATSILIDCKEEADFLNKIIDLKKQNAELVEALDKLLQLALSNGCEYDCDNDCEFPEVERASELISKHTT